MPDLQLANPKFAPVLTAIDELDYSAIKYSGVDTDGDCLAIETNGLAPFLLIAQLTKHIFCNVLDKNDTSLSLQSLFAFTYTKSNDDIMVFPSIRVV